MSHSPDQNPSARRTAGEPNLSELPPDLAGAGFSQRLRQASVVERQAARNGALLVGFVGVILLLTGWLDGPSYDLSYLFRPSTVVQDVVIVGMDDTSHRELSPRPEALWDRALHARLVERLTRAGAKAVGFDVLFDSPSAIEMERSGFVENPTDRALRQAMDTNGHVVIGAKLRRDGVSAPSPLFRGDGRWGVVEIAAGDSTIRTPVTGTPQASTFVGRVARSAGTGSLNRPPSAWLNYYGPPGTIPTVSYLSALATNETPDVVFSNKVVFIGETATLPPARDDFTSPYSRWREARINGVEVNATSYLNLVREDWLRRLPGWIELAVVLLVGSGITYGLVFVEPPRAVAIGLAGTLTLGIGLASQVWFTRLWFPWMVLAVAQLPAAVVWSVIVRSRILSAEDRKLRKFLASRKNSPLVTPPTPDPTLESDDTTRLMETEKQGRMAAPMLAPGAIPPVPDHRMIRCIGKGAYGEVWLAEDMIGKSKAVKLIRRAAFNNDVPFEREFKGLQKYTPISLSHPGLVHILHIGRNDAGGFIYYIMEAGDDVSAGQAFDPKTYAPRNLGTDVDARGPLPVREVIQTGIGIAEALSHLHRHGLIHRDIKPGNIIFVHGRPKLADIGLVTEIATPGREVTFIGTHGYMPPDGPGAPSADIYSLGKLMYVTLTALPVSSYPEIPVALLQSRDGETIRKLMRLIERACKPMESDRYHDAESFAADLRALG